MSIRLPLQAVLQDTRNSETGTSSVGGTINIPVTLPQDTDNVALKFVCSVFGAMSAQLQTTDDGGTTWYSLGRTSVVSNAVGDNAEWLSFSTVSGGVPRSASIVAVGSVISGGTIGSAQPSTISSKMYSGMPILSPTARVAIQITGNITAAASNTIVTTVYANNQAARQ